MKKIIAILVMALFSSFTLANEPNLSISSMKELSQRVGTIQREIMRLDLANNWPHQNERMECVFSEMERFSEIGFNRAFKNAYDKYVEFYFGVNKVRGHFDYEFHVYLSEDLERVLEGRISQLESFMNQLKNVETPTSVGGIEIANNELMSLYNSLVRINTNLILDLTWRNEVRSNEHELSSGIISLEENRLNRCN